MGLRKDGAVTSMREIDAAQAMWLIGATFVITEDQWDCLWERIRNPDLWENKQGWRGFQDHTRGIAVIHDFRKKTWRIILNGRNQSEETKGSGQGFG